MLYSTCTFDASENERIIDGLIRDFPEFQILPMEAYEGFVAGMPKMTDSGREELKNTVRIFPHKMKGEGHYLALLRKGSEISKTTEIQEKKTNKKIPEELADFFKNVSMDLDSSRLDIHGERVYYMPEGLPQLKGVRFLRTGLLLGELKKKRFEPSQALAMTLKKEEYKHSIDFPVSDERVKRYLKGETLEVDDLVGEKESGWYLVCVDSYPLGWGKLSRGTLKNKYLPGWRLNS